MKYPLRSLTVLALLAVATQAQAEFTKVANNGTPIDQTTPLGSAPSSWACTYDSNTQLMWEVKTADNGLRDNRWNYTWYNSDFDLNGGNSGTANGGTCVDSSNCDTEKFVTQVNNQGLCSAKDWRMPTLDELKTLVELNFSPKINTTYFPNTDLWFYWTSTPADFQFPLHAWYVDFVDGSNGYDKFNKGDKGQVRLVRSAKTFIPAVTPTTQPVAAASCPTSDATLVSIPYTGSCGLTQTSSFTLDKKSNVDRIRIWYDTNVGSNTLNYTLSGSNGYSWSGSTVKGGCDTFQKNWCEGIITLSQQLPAGSYTVSINSTSMCSNPSGQTTLVVYGCPKFIAQIASGSFVEPNNTPEQATPLLVNDVPEQGLLDNPSDQDWYEFYATAGTNYTIEVPLASIGHAINPVLELYDEAGNLVLTVCTSCDGAKVVWKATKTALFRLKVANSGPFARTAANENSYQLRIYQTDAPLVGLVKGIVNNKCTNNGVNKAEVSALLNNGISSTALTHKTGEFGLLLNPNKYSLKTTATNFIDAAKDVTVAQTENDDVPIVLPPKEDCANYVAQPLDPVIQAQRAVAVYNDNQGLLVIRDVVVGDKTFYAELLNYGNYHFGFYKAFEIPSAIHAQPAAYSYSTAIADLPSVFVTNKTLKVQLKNELGQFSPLKVE